MLLVVDVGHVKTMGLLGSWDLVTNVIRTLHGVMSNYKYIYLSYNPSY